MAKKTKKKVASKKISEVDAMKMILAGAAALGWRISFKVDSDENAPIDYLILGSDEQVDRIMDALEKHE